MALTFIHTADWQLGKPYGSIADTSKRSRLQQERVGVVDRIGTLVQQHGARFVVLAGDTFDSPTPSKAIVSAGCAAIGRLGVPVYLIPGNHDHGGPLGLWEQEFFLREQRDLAPNLRILLTPEPVDIGDAVLLPCPLLRRHEPSDLTEWLRAGHDLFPLGDPKPRIVIAHGSVQSFGVTSDDEDDSAGANEIDLTRLDDTAFDYIALGDWHGTKQIGPKTWYAGTPELDRFPKGADYGGGQTLVVTARRNAMPSVAAEHTAGVGWHIHSHTFLDDADIEMLATHVSQLIEGRVDSDLLRLELSGSLGLDAMYRLEQLVESWEARLVRLKLSNTVTISASAADIQALTTRVQDPIISRVATLLASSLDDPSTEAIARIALRELHAATR